MASRTLASIGAAALAAALCVSPLAGQGRGRGPAAPATVPAQAAAPFPSTPPKPAAPPDFNVPEPRRFTLDNGLQVALVPWGTMPKVQVMLDLRSGNAFEQAGEVWLADLTGNLIREGTTTRTGAEISQQAARMGGSRGSASARTARRSAATC